MKLSPGDFVFTKEFKLGYPFNKTHKNIFIIDGVIEGVNDGVIEGVNDGVTEGVNVLGERKTLVLKKIKTSSKQEYVILLEFLLQHSIENLKLEESLEDTPDNFLPFSLNKRESIKESCQNIELIKTKINIYL